MLWRLRGSQHGVKLLPINGVLLRRTPRRAARLTHSHPQSPLCTLQGGVTTFLCHLWGTRAQIRLKVAQIRLQARALLPSPLSVPALGSEAELRGSPKKLQPGHTLPNSQPQPWDKGGTGSGSSRAARRAGGAEVSDWATGCSQLSAHIHLSRNGGRKVKIKATATPARTHCLPGTELGCGPASIQAGAAWPHRSPGQDPHRTPASTQGARAAPAGGEAAPTQGPPGREG